MSKKSKHHLTYEERCQIYALLKSGYSKRKIGQLLERSHSTIVRETSRNKGMKGYRYKKAHEKAQYRRTQASKQPKKMTPRLIKQIVTDA